MSVLTYIAVILHWFVPHFFNSVVYTQLVAIILFVQNTETQFSS